MPSTSKNSLAVFTLFFLVVSAVFYLWPASPDSAGLGPDVSGDPTPLAAANEVPQPPKARLISESTANVAQRAPVHSGLATENRGEVVEASYSPNGFLEEALQIVAQLKRLAQDETTFHGKAGDSIDRLKALCVLAGAQGNGAASPGADTLLGAGTDAVRALELDLMERVVLDDHHGAMVRGAVLLAVGPRLEESLFDPLFNAWFLDSEMHGELLRAVALVAGLRGDSAPCMRALDLHHMAAWLKDSPEDLPGIFPLRMESMVRAGQASAMRDYLDRDPRSELFKMGASPDSMGPDARQYLVTAELCFALWGHRALVDGVVERAVLEEAEINSSDLHGRSLVYVRSANLVVHSLAICNSSMFDLVVSMSTSEDPVTAGISKLMVGVSEDGLGLVLRAKIEALRYSADILGQGDLEDALIIGGQRLKLANASGDIGNQDFAYLGDLVLDVGVGKMARACAFRALSMGGSWKAMLDTAGKALLSDAPDVVHDMALMELVKAARGDEGRRQQVLELLIHVRSRVQDSTRKASLARFIAEFSN